MKSIIMFLALLVVSNVVSADDNIVIVFDTSGSMDDNMKTAGKTRLKVAQEALIGTLSNLPSTTKVGVLTFGGWVYDIQPVNQDVLTKAIRSTRPSGGTPLYQYISVGATRLLEERQKGNNLGSYKLLVVTDGIASDPALNNDSYFRDGTPKPGVLRDVMNRGISIDAIGLDMVDDHPLSKQINGLYMRGDDPSSLKKAIEKSVAEVGFGQNQNASDEAFREISELPEEFVLASLKGLTTFSNHPIGQKAPVEQKQPDGTTSMINNPTQEPYNGSGGEFRLSFLITVVAVGVGIVFFVMSRS